VRPYGGFGDEPLLAGFFAGHVEDVPGAEPGLDEAAEADDGDADGVLCACE
jgi:hypothetical protein